MKVIWITGLSGAGKSCLALEVTKQLRERKLNVIMLDGDELRKAFAYDEINSLKQIIKKIFTKNYVY